MTSTTTQTGTRRAKTGRSSATTDLNKIREMLRSGSRPENFLVALLGLDAVGSLELVDQVQRGLSFAAFSRFQKNTGLPVATLSQLVQIPQRTLTRRKEERRLGPDESDRLIRASRVFGRALE